MSLSETSQSPSTVTTPRNRVRERFNKLRERMKIIGGWLVILMIVYGLFEVPGFIGLKVMRSVPGIDVDFMASADTYSGVTWGKQVCAEAEGIRNRWEPQVYFHPKPFASEYTNIDEHGMRKTDNAATVATNTSATIIKFFGGSTMFGYGARDVGTIPSFVSRQLRDENLNVQVLNYGRIAYTSTQELLQLINELKAGRIPDIVVFYDGVNDVETAFLGLKAGVAYSDRRLQEYVEQPRDDSAFGAVKQFFASSRTLRLVTRIKRRNREPDVTIKLRATDIDQLARDVAEAYFRNVSIVKALAAVYGFECLFYWQPTLYQKNLLTDFEASIFERPWYEGLPKTGSPEYRAFYEGCYQAVREAGVQVAEFRDISELFAPDPSPLFIDTQHPAERGNEIIARRMVRDLRLVVEARTRQRN